MGGKTARTQSCQYPCSVCAKRVGRDSINCTKCENWVQQRCCEIQGSITKAINFICRRCQGLLDKNLDEKTTLDGNDVEIADMCSYLGNLLSSEGKAQKICNLKDKIGLEKAQGCSSILCKKGMLVMIKGIL